MKVGFVVLSNDNSIDFYDIFYHDSIIGSGYKYYPEKTLKVVSEYYYVDSMDDNQISYRSQYLLQNEVEQIKEIVAGLLE